MKISRVSSIIVLIALTVVVHPWMFFRLFSDGREHANSLEHAALWGFSMTFCILSMTIYLRFINIKNLIVLCCSVLIFCIVAEFTIAKIYAKPYLGEKTYIQTGKTWGNCYPFIEDSHLSMRTKDPNNGEDALCVAYQKSLREKGFFHERSKNIALVGDSFTFGEGVEDHQTLGYYLGENFSEFNFQNHGHPGLDILNIYKMVNRLIKSPKKMEHIVYFFNINDVLLNAEIAGQQKAITDFQNVRWSNDSLGKSFAGKLLEKSAIYRLWHHAVVLRKESQMTVQNYLDSYNFKKNSIELTKTVKLLIAMDRVVKQQGLGFTVVMYPLLYKDNSGEYPFKSIHHFVEKICAEQNIAFIDAYPAFEDVKDIRNMIVHPLDYHPNDHANKTLADFLVRRHAENHLFASR